MLSLCNPIKQEAGDTGTCCFTPHCMDVWSGTANKDIHTKIKPQYFLSSALIRLVSQRRTVACHGWPPRSHWHPVLSYLSKHNCGWRTGLPHRHRISDSTGQFVDLQGLNLITSNSLWSLQHVEFMTYTHWTHHTQTIIQKNTETALMTGTPKDKWLLCCFRGSGPLCCSTFGQQIKDEEPLRRERFWVKRTEWGSKSTRKASMGNEWRQLAVAWDS